MASRKAFKLICVTTFVVIFLRVSFAYQPFNKTDPDYAASVHHLKLLVLKELEILTSSDFTNLGYGESNTDFIRK